MSIYSISGWTISVFLLTLSCTPLRVARVIDGDTVVLTDSSRVRLEGIDAPELRAGDPGEKLAGLASRDFLASLALGRKVRVVINLRDRDKYGRLLGTLYLDTLNINQALVRSGHAREWK